MLTSDTPFSVSPDPTRLFITPSLKAAVHKVKYTIDKRQGLTCLLGDAGMGKSSVLRYVYSAYEPEDNVEVAFLSEPDFSRPYAFVRSICSEFNVPSKRSLHDQKNAFKEFVLGKAEEGKNVVLMLDEAQGMDSTMLEIVRSFLNYESNRAKLLQVVLAGQLELRDRLRLPANRAIKSRIIMYSVLDPLSVAETKAMLVHRCSLLEMALPFPDAAIAMIYEAAGGNPREILRFCTNAYEWMQLTDGKTLPLEVLERLLESDELREGAAA